MFKSIRVRLTLWYTGILCVILGIFSVTVYSVLARDAAGDVDSSLNEAIDVLSRSLRHEISEHQGVPQGEESFGEVVRTVYKDSFPQVGVSVYAGERLVAAKPGPNSLIPKIGDGAGLPFTTIAGLNPLRVRNISASVEGTTSYQLLAETSLVPLHSEMAELRGVFYAAVPAALALCALGGYLLARKSLAPVLVMSAAAEQIGAHDLSRRISVVDENDELGKLASTFNRLLARLQQSFETQKRFMADSSHELKTPLFVACTAVDVTLQSPHRSEEEYRNSLTTIGQQLRRLSHIVEGMFTLALADSGAYPVKSEEFYLDEVVAECLRAAKVLADPKAISIGRPELAEMAYTGDEALIRQLLMILLDNAVKYTQRGGWVKVRAIAEAGAYRIEVEDSGPGIPEAARMRIFDRFFRADPNVAQKSPQTNGAGLGLPIARWITEMHKGSLELKHTGPDGTCFSARLPRRAQLSPDS